MSAANRRHNGATLKLDHYRAAKIVMDQYGLKAETEIMQHIHRMLEYDDHDGARLWLCVLAAYDELQNTKPNSDVLQ